MKFFIYFIILIIPIFILGNSLTADQIVDKSLEHKIFSYNNSKAKIDMILIDKNRNKEKRSVIIYSKTENNLTKTLSKFSGGAEINGVKFLSIEKKDDLDEQYVYYPAQNKINRIISKTNKNQRFLGTDFTYSDLEGKYRKDAIYKKLKDNKVGKHDCYVIEATPKKSSQYKKTVIYIRKSDFIPLKIKFYDKKDRFFKQYIVKKIQKKGGNKVISLSQIVDKDRKHATILSLDYIKFDIKIDNSLFNKNNLSY